MAKYCIEIEVPSMLSEDSRAALIHMALETLNRPEVCDQISQLEVDGRIDYSDTIVIFRPE